MVQAGDALAFFDPKTWPSDTDVPPPTAEELRTMPSTIRGFIGKPESGPQHIERWRRTRLVANDNTSTQMALEGEVVQEKKKPGRPPKPKNPMDHQQLPLPGVVPFLPGQCAPLGNQLARTHLFAPVGRGKRRMYEKTPLEAPSDVKLAYSGVQLSSGGDMDTYLVALKLAAGKEPDTEIEIQIAEFLHMMGWDKLGKESYKWLKNTFDRLSSGRIFFDSETQAISTPLLGPLVLDKALSRYTFTIPKETMRLFAMDQFGYVDLEKRKMLEKKVDLAKWLHGYANSHQKGPHRVTVKNLKKWCKYDSPIRKFREALEIALNELQRVGILENWEPYENWAKVKWIR